VRRDFLGGCARRERTFHRRLRGFRCAEHRSGRIRAAYDADVSCRRGARWVRHGYTLFTTSAVEVGTEGELRAAWGNPRMRRIAVTADIVLHACETGDPIRESSTPVVLDGRGHTLRQGCFEKRLLRQDGTGHVELRNVTLTRGGSDGPGGAVTTRGEITVIDSKVQQNLAEEPGGGIMSQRRATIIRSVITGNLANDDGGGVYARRGGIRVYDSILSANLVDGSGGALGSTGDILVVRSHLDGNTTDGDGGAIYTDEDGDVTVVDSTVSGSTADGPGGAIFTLDGDVTIVNSTLTGNRADDRGVHNLLGGTAQQAGAYARSGSAARHSARVRRRPATAHAWRSHVDGRMSQR
jgi:predicted outer membrane repeat protein